MKVTAIIPDDIVQQVKHYAHGKTLTESLIIALEEWISMKEIEKLNNEIEKQPLEFREGFSAPSIRSSNRNR